MQKQKSGDRAERTAFARSPSMRSRDLSKPIGVSAYQLQSALPEQLKSSLPTIEELEDVLETVSVETINDE